MLANHGLDSVVSDVQLLKDQLHMLTASEELVNTIAGHLVVRHRHEGLEAMGGQSS